MTHLKQQFLAVLDQVRQVLCHVAERCHCQPHWWGVVGPTFSPSVLPSYPFYKFHPTPSPDISERVKAYQENQKGCHTSLGTRSGDRRAATEGPRRSSGAGVAM